MTTKQPNAHKMYPTIVKYSQWPKNTTTISIPRSLQNWDIWSEKEKIWQPWLSRGPRSESLLRKSSGGVRDAEDKSNYRGTAPD
jgi:hypothetical protein